MLAIAAVFLTALIVFIAQNSNRVSITFLAWHWHFALGLALLAAGVAGAVVVLLAGTYRMIELRRGADQIMAADLRQHAIEHARVFLFFRYGPARNSSAVAITIGVQRGGVGGPGQGLNLVPIGVR